MPKRQELKEIWTEPYGAELPEKSAGRQIKHPLQSSICHSNMPHARYHLRQHGGQTASAQDDPRICCQSPEAGSRFP